jgi:hypothetical protein
MKIPSILLLMLSLVGCTPDKPNTTVLSAAQATDLALRLANEKSQAIGPAAQLSDGYWFGTTDEGKVRWTSRPR